MRNVTLKPLEKYRANFATFDINHNYLLVNKKIGRSSEEDLVDVEYWIDERGILYINAKARTWDWILYGYFPNAEQMELILNPEELPLKYGWGWLGRLFGEKPKPYCDGWIELKERKPFNYKCTNWSVKEI